MGKLPDFPNDLIAQTVPPRIHIRNHHDFIWLSKLFRVERVHLGAVFEIVRKGFFEKIQTVVVAPKGKMPWSLEKQRVDFRECGAKIPAVSCDDSDRCGG